MKLWRMIQARRHKVPFRSREWYNFRAHIRKEECPRYDFIEIFDDDGKYIPCPQIGEHVIYNVHGTKYIYKVVGFKNNSMYSDWLYDSDYINPIIEFVKPLKQKEV